MVAKSPNASRQAAIERLEPRLFMDAAPWIAGATLINDGSTIAIHLGPNGAAAPSQPSPQAAAGAGQAAAPEAELDFGDAPAPFPTLLADDGARHQIVDGVYLGNAIDAESDGQPDATATGDDNAGTRDEDGVTLPSHLLPGWAASITVVASAQGKLDAWIDFNGDGVWQASEKVFDSVDLVSGSNTLTIDMPSDAVPGMSFARFRFSTAGGLLPTGLAPDGEVEDYQVRIDGPGQDGTDFGDAPDSYGTMLAMDGASHTIYSDVRLGDAIDAEADGQPAGDATGDDNAGIDDEDGIRFLTALAPGAVATFEAHPSCPGYLSLWIDTNRDGAWDSSERVYQIYFGFASTWWMEFSVPQGAQPGQTFARVRFSTVDLASPTGPAPDGEVEDYRITIQPSDPRDFGDAPDTYGTTLGSNGPWHALTSDLHLGATVDGEADGQPSPNATGDDTNPPAATNDEDGVVFTSPLIPGQSATVDVTASGDGFLFAWVDFNGDGYFGWDEQITPWWTSASAGTQTVTFDVPQTAVEGPTFARFRVSSVYSLSATGGAPDGEIEDYQVNIGQSMEARYDFGDAPTPYPTLLAEDGARHLVSPDSPYLGPEGNSPDVELDGLPGPWATGDNIHASDDENGVAIPLLSHEYWDQITIEVQVGGFVDGWIDWNGNGSWEDPGEQIASGWYDPGIYSFWVYPEADAVVGTTYARFRINTQSDLPSYGPAVDGEVEDYAVTILQYHDWDLADLGDAPDDLQTPGYPTLRDNDGAFHLPSTLHLGDLIDYEFDGQPDANAQGDDLNGQPDEDGVTFPATLFSGSTASITIRSSGAGYIDAWIDFNQDGQWDYWGEKVLDSVPVVAGSNVLTFPVPADAASGFTFARFRLSSQGGLIPKGYAEDGEVEDYRVAVEQGNTDSDFGDAPDTYGITQASDGAQHTIVPDFYLGAGIDGESDGQPGPLADGDDANGIDDEDGVRFVGLLVAGSDAQVIVTASQYGKLDAWIDFNGDGMWDASEKMFDSVEVWGGENTLSFSVPADAVLGDTYARFRYSSAGGLSPTGPAPDGEVEDYAVTLLDASQVTYDFGDAPDVYGTTLAADGARHAIVPGVFLGAQIDAEADGQPTADAKGDDANGIADEDGFKVDSPIYPGAPAMFDFIISCKGYLQVWADLNHDGTWDASEHLYQWELPFGANWYSSFQVPASALPGDTAFRVRFSTIYLDSATGPAPDGEVEDYVLNVLPAGVRDFGDAPDSYGTTLAANGPWHGISNLFLGAGIDAETDGQPSANATGDDTNPPAGPNDEDGVIFTSPLVPGQTATLQVTSSASGNLSGWIDFNGDGVFGNDESIANGTHVNAGSITVTFDVPATAVEGATFARFRVSSLGWMGPTGASPDGEVEDYRVHVGASGTISGTTFHDRNGNHAFDAGDAAGGGWTVYLDANGSGALDPGEPSMATGPDGLYQFTDLAPGNYIVRELPSAPWVQTTPWPSSAYTVALAGGETVAGNDFGHALPGDANGDGIVDQADYTVWYNHYGSSVPMPAADEGAGGDAPAGLQPTPEAARIVAAPITNYVSDGAEIDLMSPATVSRPVAAAPNAIPSPTASQAWSTAVRRRLASGRGAGIAWTSVPDVTDVFQLVDALALAPVLH